MSSSSSYPRKLLKSDPKPKPVPARIATPLNSASSSSTTNAPPCEKRTRDQLNLSDCHCCGRRINHTNPKDRLHPMDSFWRIVLLCRKCRKKFASGQTCPYCFKETVKSASLFKCSVCRRKVHQECVEGYKNCAPWCYLGADSRSRVCVDCWIPKSLQNSIGACGTGGDRSVYELDKTFKDSSCDVMEDVDTQGKKLALMKLSGIKNAMNCEHTLDLIAKKDMSDQEGGILEWGNKINTMEDADLAVRLHRTINSSPRISRGKCVVNSSSDTVKSGDSNGLSCRKSSLGEDQSESQSANSSENERNSWANINGLCSDAHGSFLEPLTYKRDKQRKTWNIIHENAVVSMPGSSNLEKMKFMLHLGDERTGSATKLDDDIWGILICVNSDKNSSCINVDRFGQQPIVYKRARFSRKVFQENGIAEWSSCGSQRDACMHQTPQPGCLKTELHVVDGTECAGQCNSSMIFSNESCSTEYDRYLIKYDKRVKGSKSCPNQQCYLTFLIENQDDKRVIGSKSDPYHLYTDNFGSENQACTPCASNSGASYSAKCDGEFPLPLGTNHEESDPYIFKYRRRAKGSY